MKFDNKLFDNLILHACGITIVDYDSVEKVDTNYGVYYYHFAEGYVPEDILIREA